MAANFPVPTTSRKGSDHLFASVDMGTNSFKLVIVRADPSTGRFLTLDRLKVPVVLGRDTSTVAPTTISSASQLRSLDALCKFQHLLRSHHIPSSHSRLVATSAVREALNQSEFISTIHRTLGFEVDVLSGYEEARLTYLGALQFYPVYHNTVLSIDIGGGSTEFVIGKEGKVLFGISLKLGHVTLTQEFVKNDDIRKLREHVHSVIQNSGLVEKVANFNIDVVIGSSGTICAIEKAVYCGYERGLGDTVVLLEGCRKDWRISMEELGGLVKSLCTEEDELCEKVRRDGFFKRRSEFIVAGAVLLEEIFGVLGIEEMEVSGYALGEGLIAEIMAKFFDGYDLNVNARWQSVVRLAMRFNNKKRMKSAALLASIAKEILEGLRECDELALTLDERDIEYLEAASLLHNIGQFTGKKGYHKRSCHIITNGDHLCGYGTNEIKLIALLVRHHIKKFPKFDATSLKEFSDEEKQKIRMLCVIIRLSAVIHQCQSVNVEGMKFSHTVDSVTLVINRIKNQPLPPGSLQPLSESVQAELGKELEHFREVFQQKAFRYGSN